MDDLQLFRNDQFGDIRIIGSPENPLFNLEDISLALGYTTKSKGKVYPHKVRINKVIENADIKPVVHDEQLYINEDNLYDFILESRTDNSRAFRKWITADVLPTIRKTGGYINNTDTFIESYFPDMPDEVKVFMKQSLIQIDKHKETIQQQQDLIAEQSPKVIFANALMTAESNITIGEMAKILNQNGFKTGQNRFFNWLRENGYIMNTISPATNKTPTQKSIDLDILHLKQSTIARGEGKDKKTFITSSSVVTPKGQHYFLNKLCI